MSIQQLNYIFLGNSDINFDTGKNTIILTEGYPLKKDYIFKKITTLSIIYYFRLFGNIKIHRPNALIYLMIFHKYKNFVIFSFTAEQAEESDKSICVPFSLFLNQVICRFA